MSDRSDKPAIRSWCAALRWLGLVLILVLGISGFLEILVRLDFIRERLPLPSVGSRNRQLDEKLVDLEAISRREGPPQILFLGSSMLYRDVDPEVFNRAFQARSGRAVRSYNFGLKGMVEHGIPALAGILAEDYRLKVVIYGISPLALGLDEGTKMTRTFGNNPWVRYRSGQFQFDGWLIEHSMVFRYYLGLAAEQTAQERLAGHKARKARPSFTNLGYAVDDQEISRRDPASPLWTFRPPGAPSWALAHYVISTRCLQALRDMTRPNGQTTFILLELPVHEGAMSYLGRGRADYQSGLAKITSLAEQNGVPFWRCTSGIDLDDRCWANPTHLNDRGAKIFSPWVAARLVEAIQNKEIADPIE